MNISEFLDCELKSVTHDCIIEDLSGNDITGSIKLSDYEDLEVESVRYQMIAIIKVKKAT